MNGSEFEELKNGPKHGDVNDCSDKDKCNANRGTCVKTTSFYSFGWVNTTTYFLLPVGDVRYRMITTSNASFKLMIKGQEFASIDNKFFNLSNICYKKEKVLKAENWEIDDINYINSNHQNFTHLFTFNIMPIKAMRQSLQNILGGCKKNPAEPGCDKEATLLKCDEIFIRFDKEYSRMLVPVQTSTTTQSTKGESTTGEETNDYYVETTRKGFTKYPKTSELGTFAIVLITLGILICITIFIGVLIFFVFCVFCGKDEKKNKPNEEEQSPYSPITETNKDFAIGEKGVHSKGASSTVVGTQIDPTESLNNPSTVVDTQLDFDVKAGAEVPDSIMD
uniref:Uncharacterized protein n=1 Tax=Meloidogyne javanica TaxID=6303 RepID=A0A915M158_MELJA